MLAPPHSSAQEARRNPSVALHLADVDIRQFLRLAHELTGANIVIAPDVRGRVTAFIQDVPWDEAFDAIIRSNGLIAVQDGRVLHIMTAADAAQRRAVAEAALSAEPLEVCTYHLENADAQYTTEILREFLSPQGRIAADARTNTLFVSDHPQVLTKLGFMPVPASRGHCIPGG